MVHFQWWDSKLSELKFVCAGLYHRKEYQPSQQEPADKNQGSSLMAAGEKGP